MHIEVLLTIGMSRTDVALGEAPLVTIANSILLASGHPAAVVVVVDVEVVVVVGGRVVVVVVEVVVVVVVSAVDGSAELVVVGSDTSVRLICLTEIRAATRQKLVARVFVPFRVPRCSRTTQPS